MFYFFKPSVSQDHLTIGQQLPHPAIKKLTSLLSPIHTPSQLFVVIDPLTSVEEGLSRIYCVKDCSGPIPAEGAQTGFCGWCPLSQDGQPEPLHPWPAHHYLWVALTGHSLSSTTWLQRNFSMLTSQHSSTQYTFDSQRITTLLPHNFFPPFFHLYWSAWNFFTS